LPLIGGLILQHNPKKIKIMKAITENTVAAGKPLNSKEMALNLGLADCLAVLDFQTAG
jgi:hypothetical protein